MVTDIDVRKVQALIHEGAQLVDVLPREEYEQQHLPGAANIPLRELDEKSTAWLDRDRAIIVYCYDSQ